MKGIHIALVGLLFVVALGYLGAEVINKHIDRESGAIVERTLSDNTIHQLELLSEVKSLISAGETDQAIMKLSEAADTLVYILKNNCALPKCEEALRDHESN
jgi:hypothetical protein